MAAVRLQKMTLMQLPNRWAGTRDKVSARKLLLSIAVTNFSSCDYQLVEELIFDLDPNHDGVITEEEFNVICKYIS